MKNYVILSFLLIFLFACDKKQEALITDIPECVQAIIDAQPSLDIYAQEVDNQFHYWINTGESAVDGTEPILNTSCDTICTFGGWITPECYNVYVDSNWQKVNP